MKFSDGISFVYLLKHRKVSREITTINRSCINTSPANPLFFELFTEKGIRSKY